MLGRDKCCRAPTLRCFSRHGGKRRRCTSSPRGATRGSPDSCHRLARLSFFFFFSSRRRHTRCSRDWSSDVCSSDLYYLGLRLVESYLTEHGLASTLRAAADEFRKADERALGIQTA